MGGSSYGKEYVCNCVFNFPVSTTVLQVAPLREGGVERGGSHLSGFVQPPPAPNTPPGSSNPQTPPKHPPRLPTLLAILPFLSYTPSPANPLSSFSQFSSQLSVT